MKRTTILLWVVLIAVACTQAPPPATAPSGEERFLVDPRTGFTGATTPAIDKRFNTAWGFFRTGDLESARQRFSDLRTKNPAYLPAQLGLAAVALRQGSLETARAMIDHVRGRQPQYTAAEVFAAELAIADKQTRRALEIYRSLAARPDAPATVRERLGDIERRLFDELFHAARTAPDAEAIPLLREALAVTPGATAARILLVQKLIAQRQFDDARRELEPLLASDPARADVQEALAEIDAGRGRFEEAIARYERLARRDPAYARRLEEIKQRWIAANMPAHFQTALASSAITREDLAVLLYWRVSSIRFAQNVGTPIIAIDIDVPGREELIRAIAFGILDVDAVTRRVSPSTPVTAGALTRRLARVLLSRGAACARQVPAEAESARAPKVLAACRVDDPTSTAGADAPVNGHTAAALIDQVERALTR